MENFRDLGVQPWKKEVKARPQEEQTLTQLHDLTEEMKEAWPDQRAQLFTFGSENTEQSSAVQGMTQQEYR